MQTLSVEEAIQKPAPQVWEALTDWTNAHQVDARNRRDDCRGRNRHRYETDFPSARGADRSSTIIHCDVGRSIVLRSIQGGVTADYTYEVHEIDGAVLPSHPGRQLSDHGAMVETGVTPASSWQSDSPTASS